MAKPKFLIITDSIVNTLPFPFSVTYHAGLNWYLVIVNRFSLPLPRFIIFLGFLEQARFLLAKLNPSATYNNATDIAAGSDVIFTDDVSLQVFFEHLQRLAVQS